MFSKLLLETYPSPANIPIAIGRSYPVPSFLIFAGDRFMVILLGSIYIPQFFRDTFTLSLASLTSELRSPINSKTGSPSDMSTSTFTR